MFHNGMVGNLYARLGGNLISFCPSYIYSLWWFLIYFELDYYCPPKKSKGYYDS
jgi:hypothetical protein